MALFRSFPNQFSGALTATSTSNSTGTLQTTGAVDFGFNAGLIKMVIDAGGPAYVQFNGNQATTGDYRLSSADTLTDWYDIGVGVAGISLCATSTVLSMRLGAWG